MKDRITITDSLDRREVLHTQGEAGLKRVVKNTRTAASRRVSLTPWAGSGTQTDTQTDNRIQPGCGDGPHHAHHHAGWQGISVYY